MHHLFIHRASSYSLPSQNVPVRELIQQQRGGQTPGNISLPGLDDRLLRFSDFNSFPQLDFSQGRVIPFRIQHNKELWYICIFSRDCRALMLGKKIVEKYEKYRQSPHTEYTFGNRSRQQVGGMCTTWNCLSFWLYKSNKLLCLCLILWFSCQTLT